MAAIAAEGLALLPKIATTITEIAGILAMADIAVDQTNNILKDIYDI